MKKKPLISFDYAIKYLLKNKGDHEIIEAFISDLLKVQGYKPVKIIALLDSESNQEDGMCKRSIADLVVEDTDHQKYIVEIERNYKPEFMHKACFNTARLIVDNIAEGVEYSNIVKVFHISLLYFSVGDAPLYHGKTVIEEMESRQRLTFHIEDPKTKKVFDTTQIFPEYFFISVPEFNDRIEREIDEWLYLMKHDAVSPNFRSPYMKKVAERLSILQMTPEERNCYVYYQKKLHDEKLELKAALAEGEAKGIAKGIAKERAESEAKIAKERAENEARIAKERAENEARMAKERAENEDKIAKERAESETRMAKEKVEIVKELILEEFSLEQISRITKLDLQTVQVLAAETLVYKNFQQFAALTLEKEMVTLSPEEHLKKL